MFTNILFMIMIYFFSSKSNIHFNFLLNYIIILGTFNSFVTILSANLPQIFDVQKYFLSQKTSSYTSFILTDGVIRARSLIADYELTTEFLSISFLILISKFLNEKITPIKILITIILSLGILYSGSRSMIFLLSFGFLLFLGIYTISMKKHSFRLIPIYLVIAIAISILSFYAEEQINNIIFRIQNIKIYSGIIDNREWIWLLYLEEFFKNPILGNGYFRQSRINLTDSDPHSLYIHILFSFGILGFSLFVIFIGRMIKIIISTIKNSNFYIKNVAISILVALLIFLIDQYKITFLREENYQLFIFLFFGIIFSLKKHSLKKQSDNM
ncbi:MAG: O-antigen ligase family protein [Candidatus Goldbacteria bacterium]|nr:O-antigen ligase family protein [Candidatus Goldiibacteriota bacterium]